MARTPLIYERAKTGRRGYLFPELDVPATGENVPATMRRKTPPALPEVPENEVVRHYVNLSHRNHSVDTGFYPLGSCTMKYNPKINEEIAALPGFASVHPSLRSDAVQGILELLYKLTESLCHITGMDWGTLQPYAGAHGEFTGMKLFRSWFAHRGETQRQVILVPDSAHGTNPASAHIAGFEVVEIPSDSRGLASLEAIQPYLNDSLAGIMLTNPNTLGLFEADITEISKAVHAAGGLLYYDGANLNAIMGKCRPGDMGFDVVHVNLHKTFSTPHGGGGPGAGPVLVTGDLKPFLPSPVLSHTDDAYSLEDVGPLSIGRVASFHGNVGVAVRAYAYVLSMGGDGLERATEDAVLNANYLKEKLSEYLFLPYPALCKHEFVLSAKGLKDRTGVSAMDVAKNLIDAGIHPPTVYFPLIIPEALMVEPTETETVESLDSLVAAVAEIAKKAETDPEAAKAAPLTTPVRRVDEVRAARNPILRWTERTPQSAGE